jgi:hypothetical protein
LLGILAATPATRDAIQPVLEEFTTPTPVLEMEDVFALANHASVNTLLSIVYDAGTRGADKTETLFAARGNLISACAEALPVDSGIPDDDDM